MQEAAVFYEYKTNRNKQCDVTENISGSDPFFTTALYGGLNMTKLQCLQHFNIDHSTLKSYATNDPLFIIT